MNQSDTIALPEQDSLTRKHRTFSSLDSPNNEVGRDLIDFLGTKKVVEELLADTNIDVVSIHKERKKRWLNYLGKGVSFFFAVGCGVTAAAALATLVAGPLFYVLAAILCLSTTYANYRMTNNNVSNIFVGGIKGLFHKKVIVETEGDVESADQSSPYLSKPKLIVLGVGTLLSLAFGMVFGALTYGSTVGLVTAFGFLGAVSVALPPIGIALAVFTFITLTCVMVKAYSDNLKEKKTGSINIFSKDPVRDKDKSDARFYAERAVIGIIAATLVVGTFALVIWGQISTLMNCAREFGKILTSITNASSGVVNIVSNIIGIGCALAAQIPFIIQTSVQPIIKLFTRSKDNTEKPLETTRGEKLKSVLLVVTSAFSAAATAAIALSGKSVNILSIMAGAGAFINNFLGSVVNATISQPLPAAPVKAESLTVDTIDKMSSTAAVNAQLQYNKDFTFERSPDLSDLKFNVDDDYFDPDKPTAKPTVTATNTPTPAVITVVSAVPPTAANDATTAPSPKMRSM